MYYVLNLFCSIFKGKMTKKSLKYPSMIQTGLPPNIFPKRKNIGKSLLLFGKKKNFREARFDPKGVFKAFFSHFSCIQF